jgi:uncharacterized membrane protein
MRWIHIASVAALIGGSLYAWQVWTRSVTGLPSDVQESLGESAGRYFRPLVLAAIAGLLISGLYGA